jgi:phosphatidate cytidylyltransferase
LIYLGGWFYFIPLLLIIGLATLEYVHLFGELGWRVPRRILLPTVFVQLIVAQWSDLNLFAPALAGSLFVAMGYALWSYERRLSNSVIAEWMAVMAGILLLGWLSAHFFRLRGLGEMAYQWTILAMLATWLADSAAYLIGTWRGKHKLAPRLSPNKTVEGYAAGILLGTPLTALIAVLLNLPLLPALVLGLLISVISPAGDLAISLLKREAGAKDSGHMLPGHGGALDRIDSLIWSVTIAYYFVSYLG